MAELTTATKLTLMRMLLIPFVAMGILYQHYGFALLIFLISGLTDLLDGLIARRWKQKTKLGALLDPMADKLLMAASFILLTFPAAYIKIPVWLTVMVFGRDIIIVVSAVSIALTTGFTKFDPTFYGKVSTATQVLCILAVLVANHFHIHEIYIEWLFYLTFGLTLFSGVHYIYTFTKRFNVVS